MSARPGDRGIAVPAALLTLLVATLVSATVAELARTELGVARDRRIAAEALTTADACVAAVAATLPAGWDYVSVLAGPDGVAGTSDDGIVAAPPGCSARLTPGPGGARRPYLDAVVTVPGGGRAVRAILARAVHPPTPSVLWARDAASLGGVSGALALDGVDARRPEASPLPGIASGADPTLADAWLAANPSVTLAAATGTAAHAPPPPIADLAALLLGLVGWTPIVVAPGPPAPTLQATSGDLVIATPGFGAGLLYVEGRLDIRADFSFSGLVVAVGGVRLASGATFAVDGAVWVGGAPALDLAGSATMRYGLAALEAVDALVPLPRRAAVVGLEDR
ncbi:MAG: hypothetical protein ACREQL_15155 [Candidatus Binatia bacterium]